MKKTFTISELPDIAKMILAHVGKEKREGALVVTVTGDLGAGKTSLIQAIAKKLQIKETVHSPTFVILKRYLIPKTASLGVRFSNLIHIDAYRLMHEQELSKLGWHELVHDQKNLIFLEWPEKVPGLIPKDAISISLDHKGEARRISW